MRSAIGPCTVLTLVVLSAVVSEAGLTDQGTHEIMGSCSWDSFTASYEDVGEATTSTLLLSPTYGYFFADHFELQARVIVASSHSKVRFGSSVGSASATTWTPMLGVLGHAPVSDTYVPYFGGGIGWSWYSDSEGTEADATLIFPIIIGGAKVLVAESTAVDLGLYYMHQENALYSEGIDGSEWGWSVGLSLLLGSEAAPEERGREDNGQYPRGWWD